MNFFHVYQVIAPGKHCIPWVCPILDQWSVQLAQNDHSNIFWDDPSCVKLTCNNVWQRTLAQPPACIENKTTIYSIHALFVPKYIYTDNISPKQNFAITSLICFLIYFIYNALFCIKYSVLIWRSVLLMIVIYWKFYVSDFSHWFDWVGFH